ncbi:hypothetical protein DRN69_03880 [Candidatus Pacearchaeota archaeon]|nr:MAG: hypothetical protein DRN69_03880 [Candidatus Pacearchaeota archaeon]
MERDKIIEMLEKIKKLFPDRFIIIVCPSNEKGDISNLVNRVVEELYNYISNNPEYLERNETVEIKASEVMKIFERLGVRNSNTIHKVKQALEYKGIVTYIKNRYRRFWQINIDKLKDLINSFG